LATWRYRVWVRR
ncbi:rhs element Vgr family protein, partial [Escherichia coli FDA504]